MVTFLDVDLDQNEFNNVHTVWDFQIDKLSGHVVTLSKLGVIHNADTGAHLYLGDGDDPKKAGELISRLRFSCIKQLYDTNYVITGHNLDLKQNFVVLLSPSLEKLSYCICPDLTEYRFARVRIMAPRRGIQFMIADCYQRLTLLAVSHHGSKNIHFVQSAAIGKFNNVFTFVGKNELVLGEKNILLSVAIK